MGSRAAAGLLFPWGLVSLSVVACLVPLPHRASWWPGWPWFLQAPWTHRLHACHLTTHTPKGAALSHLAECEHQGDSFPHCHKVKGSSYHRAL